MIKNVGKTDKTIRIVMGAILALLAVFTLKGTAQLVVSVGALIALITGLTGFCGLYSVLGINSCKVKK